MRANRTGTKNRALSQIWGFAGACDPKSGLVQIPQPKLSSSSATPASTQASSAQAQQQLSLETEMDFSVLEFRLRVSWHRSTACPAIPMPLRESISRSSRMGAVARLSHASLQHSPREMASSLQRTHVKEIILSTKRISTKGNGLISE
jgi:hypothetical protein